MSRGREFYRRGASQEKALSPRVQFAIKSTEEMGGAAGVGFSGVSQSREKKRTMKSALW